jgi:hypothetical protein
MFLKRCYKFLKILKVINLLQNSFHIKKSLKIGRIIQWILGRYRWLSKLQHDNIIWKLRHFRISRMQDYLSVLQEGDVHLSLSTFNSATAQPPFLNSPRSLEACRLHGIIPVELAGRSGLMNLLIYMFRIICKIHILCIYIHMYTYMYICIYEYVSIYLCIYIYIHIFINTYMSMSMYRYIWIHTHTYICMYM